MNPIFEAAQELQELCVTYRWRFCFIGGLAVLRWGEPRLTRDVDVTILTGYGTEQPIVDTLLEHFSGRTADVRGFALQHRVLLLHASNHIPLDIALGALPFEERATQRAVSWPISNEMSLRICCAEDLIAHKAFAGRQRDWLDIEGIVLRQGPELDRELIYQELIPLLKLKDSSEEGLNRLKALLD